MSDTKLIRKARCRVINGEPIEKLGITIFRLKLINRNLINDFMLELWHGDASGRLHKY